MKTPANRICSLLKSQLGKFLAISQTFHHNLVDRQRMKPGRCHSNPAGGQEVPPAALQLHRKCENKRLYSIKHPTQSKLEQAEPLCQPKHWSETTFMNHVTSVHRHKKESDSEKPKPQKGISIFFFQTRHYLVMGIFPRSAVTHIEQNKKGSPLVPLPEWKICEDTSRARQKDHRSAAAATAASDSHFPV